MSKHREKKEREDGIFKISRRTVLKAGAATGALTVLTSRKAFKVYGQNLVTEPVLCDPPPDPPPTSPPTTPFADFLPIPNAAAQTALYPKPTKSANIAGGEAARDDHQRWEEFLPQALYLMEARAAVHTFHTDLLPSYVWGFNGQYPAQTILNQYGSPTLVRFKNSLPDPTTSFGRNEITVHLHNGHTASESDGFAGDYFPSGLFKDNHYANAYAGVDAFGGNGDPREAMHTFWFHDHRAAFTAPNNYLGLNGMYIAYDATDPGHEDATWGSLRLPGIYGQTDIPLILTDKRFCPAAFGRNEMFQVVGAGAPAGDKWVVNGAIQPEFEVHRRKYRFRILNTGPAKQWNLTLINPDGTPGTMTVVAVDANFLEHASDVTSGPLTVNVASRYDVIVDFSAYAVGDHVYLKEAAQQFVGIPVTDLPPGLAIENVVMRFDVIDGLPIPDTPPIPDPLVEMPDPLVPDASFTWTFKLVNGRFLVNDMEFDANRVDHVVLKGSTEEWTLANDVAAGNWLHPVHIHFEEGRIQSRRVRISQNPDVFQDVPLTFDELGRRDVYPLPPQHRVVMRMRFRDFVGRYLIHCHNMNHEDGFMMVRWDIVDTLAELRKRREEIAQQRREAGVPLLVKEVLG